MRYLFHGIVVLFSIMILSLIATGFYAGHRQAEGRNYEKLQPMLVTDQGIFACKYDHVGRTIFSDYKCGQYVLLAPLPAGAEPTITLPAGTKSIQID